MFAETTTAADPRPIIFTDLDDTLFQTKRKINDARLMANATPGALDRTLQPRSFMTAKQANLVAWMLQNAETIPVTARGTQEIKRVCIPFSSYAITTHGAVILTPEGYADAQWQALILERMSEYQPRLAALEQHLSTMLAAPQSVSASLPAVPAWCRMNEEYGQAIYLVMKVNNSEHLAELNRYADWVEQTFDLEGFYVHRNGNNVAWLPRCIEKVHAVNFLLARLQATSPERPVLGFGDSLSDFSFMRQCDFVAIPQKSQLLDALDHTLSKSHLPSLDAENSHAAQ